jgi:hypothetical protein
MKNIYIIRDKKGDIREEKKRSTGDKLFFLEAKFGVKFFVEACDVCLRCSKHKFVVSANFGRRGCRCGFQSCLLLFFPGLSARCKEKLTFAVGLFPSSLFVL